MLRVALRGLLAHKARMLLTFLAVALGVAFVGGVLVLTDTMNRAFDDLFADVYRNTDAVVRSDQKVESDFGPEVRGNIDEALLPDVEDADGVAGAEGVVGGYAQIIDRFGDPVGDPAFGAPTLGGNWSEIDELNPFNLAEGRAPRTDDEIVIDRASAKATDFVVGDDVEVQTRDGVGTYTVSGIARFGTADSPGGASYVLWTTDEAQRLLVEPDKFSSIVAAADDGVSQEEVAANIRDALPADSGTQVVTGAEITNETQDSIKEGLSFLTYLLPDLRRHRRVRRHLRDLQLVRDHRRPAHSGDGPPPGASAPAGARSAGRSWSRPPSSGSWPRSSGSSWGWGWRRSWANCSSCPRGRWPCFPRRSPSPWPWA